MSGGTRWYITITRAMIDTANKTAAAYFGKAAVEHGVIAIAPQGESYLATIDLHAGRKAKASAAEALRATVESEQAQRQNDVQIATLTGNIRELDSQAEIARLKQQIADSQLKSVLTQLELGSGAGTGPGAPQPLSPKAEQLARIDERQKFEDALEAGFDLSKTRLTLLKSLGHMEDWLNELHSK